MKSCPDCGRDLGDDEGICPLCGARIPADGAEPPSAVRSEEPLTNSDGFWNDPDASWTDPDAARTDPDAFWNDPDVSWNDPDAAGTKPRSRKPALIVAVTLAAVAVAAAVLFFALGKSPRDQFLLQHEKLAQTLAAQEFSFLSDLADAKEYSLDATLTLDSGNYKLMKNAVRLKLAVDETLAALDAEVSLGDSGFLNGSLRFDMEVGTLGFSLPQISEKYYVADWAAQMETLAPQDFADGYLTGAQRREARGRMAKTYGGILISTVKSSNVSKQKDVFFLFSYPETSTNATAYVFQPTAEDLEDLFFRLADALEADQDLPRVTPFDNETRTEWVEALRRNGSDWAKSLAGSDFTWAIRANKRGFYQVELTRHDGDGDAFLRFERTPNSLYLAERGLLDPVENGPRELIFSYFEDENGANGACYHGNASLTGLGPGLEFENVRPGQTSALGVPYGTYKFSTDSYLLMELNVSAATEGGTDHTLRLDDYSGDDPETFVFNLYTTDAPVTLTEPAGEREDITDYTDEELEALGAELLQRFSRLLLNRFISTAASSYYGG